MSAKQEKILQAMRDNPKDWTISDVERVGRAFGLSVRPPKRGSHYTVSSPHSTQIVTVPHKRPIKSVYIKKFVALVVAHRASQEKQK